MMILELTINAAYIINALHNASRDRLFTCTFEISLLTYLLTLSCYRPTVTEDGRVISELVILQLSVTHAGLTEQRGADTCRTVGHLDKLR